MPICSDLQWASVARNEISHFDSLSFRTLNANARARTLFELENDLADLHHTTCALRRRRNLLVPISRLPSEILSYIFAFVAAQSSPRPRTILNPPHIGAPGSLGWIVLTHVCQNWRDIALDNPGLWANCVCALPAATAEMLARSRKAPIIVTHNLGWYRSKTRALKSVELALTQISRVKVINLSVDHRNLDILTGGLVTTPAPQLESIEISLSGDVRLSFLFQLASLPPDIFAGVTPRLRRISLENCTIQWTSGILSNLIYIEIKLHAFSVPEMVLPTAEQVLNVLRRCPTLRELVLIDTLPDHPDPITFSQTAGKLVGLPCLERLVLSDKALSCADLLQNLSTPHSAALELSCTSLGSSAECLSILLPFIRPHTQTLQKISVGTGTSCLQLCGYSTSTSDRFCFEPCRADDPDTRQKLALSFLFTNMYPLANLGKICSGLGLGEVRVLELEAEVVERYTFDAGEWKGIFRLMPLLSEVTVRGSTAHDVLQALTTSAGMCLRTLRLRGVNFYCQTDDGDGRRPLLDACVAFLEAEGRAVELRIEMCTIRHESIVRLRDHSISAKIVWDGKEDGIALLEQAIKGSECLKGRDKTDYERDYYEDTDAEYAEEDEDDSEEEDVGESVLGKFY
ncbi:hypothetical protein EW146_g7468 [Bondarzewia mesenterica]|uniref:F-box domain-containing protein n=1 Tax=Bondarzewia mesenterica TaxID=1095465 RepID=A0A4S4LL90_9AGAM|nr:hypothetical protein EW146_g7468 [Bondarzewia mesenterica]